MRAGLLRETRQAVTKFEEIAIRRSVAWILSTFLPYWVVVHPTPSMNKTMIIVHQIESFFPRARVAESASPQRTTVIWAASPSTEAHRLEYEMRGVTQERHAEQDEHDCDSMRLLCPSQKRRSMVPDSVRRIYLRKSSLHCATC